MAEKKQMLSTNKLLEVLAYWLTNTVVLLVLSSVLGGNVVLGNDKLSMPLAGVFAGLLLTGANYLVEPILTKIGYKMKDNWVMGVFYLADNILALWIIKKLALTTGLGISNNLFLVIVAIVATGAQWGVYKYAVAKYLNK